MDKTRRNVIVAGSIILAAGLAPLLAIPRMMGGRKDNMNSTVSKTPLRPRPPGNPLPALQEDIGPILARLDKWLAANPAMPVTLNPPASENALKDFEDVLGRALPSAFHQLYRWHDGETLKTSAWGILFGTEFLSLARIHDEYKLNTKLMADFGGKIYDKSNAAWPEAAVDPAWINPYWITIGADGSGNSIGIDLDPWPKGRVGQVILFGRDQLVKAVIFPSLGSFLDWFIQQLENGNWTIEQRGGSPHLALPEAKGNHLFEALRQMVGAPGPY